MAMPPVRTLGQLLDHLLDVGKAAFRVERSGLVLVGPPPETDADDWAFRTGSLRTVRTGQGSRVALLEERYVVLQLKKVQDGPFKDTVLIGRAKTNDIILADESVSKLHARAKPGIDGRMMLFDAGSSNGTFIAERRLIPDKGEVIEPGDIVTFGSLAFHVFDAEGLLEVLERLKDA